MTPSSGRRPGQRSGLAAFAPLIVAVCVIIAVREGVEALLPEASTWVAFIAALVAGWLAYTAVERYYAQRGSSRGRQDEQ
jgi:membrane protein implicated in regulation of membrane protease activity